MARGWCNKHWKRWKAHGDPLFTKLPRGDDEARFWAMVDRRGDDECWPWKGHLGESGYAIFSAGGKSVRAHRWAYEHFVEPIPEGFHIDHVKANGCIRRDCTNYIRHLEPVTPGENTQRAFAHTSDREKCKHGHDLTPENTRMNGTRKDCRQCERDRALKSYYKRKAEREDAAA